LPDDPATAEEFVQLHGARIRESTTVRLIMKIIESEQVGEKITGMQWHLGRLEGLRYPLLTSDRPMVMTNGLIALSGIVIATGICMIVSPKYRNYVTDQWLRSFSDKDRESNRRFVKNVGSLLHILIGLGMIIVGFYLLHGPQ